ncbi:hypothetical protein D3C75_665950 [compost metagenome]
MQFSTNSTEIAANLKPRNISPLADHSHCNNPTAVAIFEPVDYLLRVRGSGGHDLEAFALVLQRHSDLVGMLDIRGNNQARGIRFKHSHFIEFLAPQVEQLAERVLMTNQVFV